MKRLTLRFGLLFLGIILLISSFFPSAQESNNSSGLLGFGIIFILLGLLFVTRSSLLGFGNDLQTINGIGTTLYGKSNLNQGDNSYITTKWYVFFWFPIIPLVSYRVIMGETKSTGTYGFSIVTGTKSNIQMKDVPMNKTQIIKTYLKAYSLVALMVIFLYLIS